MTPLIENRQIRVFVSSTFEDMKPERDYLMKVIFPRLRKKAEERYVTLIELDLRWGVTEEEVTNGKVVQICLEEIDNSHPFFIGLLGNRYGWCPPTEIMQQNVNLSERFPWIGKDLESGLSITEIEMQYGVLRRNKELVHACFLLRKSNETLDSRLTRLREHIRRHAGYPFYEYSRVEEMGAWIEGQFSSILDQLFPETAMSILEQNRMAQRTWLRSLTKVYVPKESNFSLLDEFLHDTQARHLVIVGGFGSGKSALIANWVQKLGEESGFNVLYHFVGRSDNNGDYRVIQSRLIEEIRDIYDLPLPDKAFDRGMLNNDVSKTLQELMMLIISRKPLLLIIEGLDHLADPDDETPKLLNWLPVLPLGSKMLFTTTEDDQSMVTCQRYDYPIFRIEALTRTERTLFIRKYLALYGKKLSFGQMDKIISASSLGNPLLLKALLDELICLGSHFELDCRIDHYLASKDIGDFFERIVARAEEDYGERLVLDTLSLIVLSTKGLYEAELLEIISIPPLMWSAFYCSFSGYFTFEDGRIKIANVFMRWITENRLLTFDTQLSYRQRIISYFERLDCRLDCHDSINKTRIWTELIHQYAESGMMEKLHKIVLRREVFTDLIQNESVILMKAWRVLVSQPSCLYSLEDYLSSDQLAWDGEDYANLAYFISEYFNDSNLALKVYDKILPIYRQLAATDMCTYGPKLSYALYNSAQLLTDFNSYNEAFERYFESLTLCRTIAAMYPIPIVHHEATVLWAIGSLHASRREYANSEKSHAKALQIRRRLAENDPDKYLISVVQSLNNLGVLHKATGDYGKANIEFCESLDICRKLSMKNPGLYASDLSMLLANLGDLHREMQDYYTSERYCEEALRLMQEIAEIFPEKFLGDVGASLNTLGLIHTDMLEYTKAKLEYQEALEIFRGLSNKQPDEYESYVAITLMNLGSLHWMLNEYQTALSEFQECLLIRKNLAKKQTEAFLPDIADTLINIGIVYSDMLEFNQAVRHYLEALTIYRKLVENCPDIYAPKIAMLLSNLGVSHSELKDYSAAASEYHECLTIRRRLAEKYPDVFQSSVADILNNIGLLHTDMLRYNEAECECVEALRIYRTLNEKNPNSYDNNVAASLLNLGLIHYHLKDYSSTEKEWNESLEIYQNLADKYPDAFLPNVVDCLNNLGILYISTRDFSKSEECYAESIAIIRRLESEAPECYTLKIARGTANLSELYLFIKNYSEAEIKAQEALRIYSDLNITSKGNFITEVSNALNLLGVIHTHTGDYAIAEEELLKALEATRVSMMDNEEAYRSTYSTILDNLGHLYVLMEKYDQATEQLEEAINYRQILASITPETYETDVAETLGHLGDLYAALDVSEEAERYYIGALAVYEKYRIDDSPLFPEKISEMKISLTRLQNKRNQ